MTTENVSFQDALLLVKNKIVNKSSSFLEMVLKLKFNTVKESNSASITVSIIPQSYGSIKKSNNI